MNQDRAELRQYSYHYTNIKNITKIREGTSTYYMYSVSYAREIYHIHIIYKIKNTYAHIK